jgi:hypothetical protein
MMGLLFILPVSAITLAVIIGVFRRLRLAHTGRRWWLLFGANCLIGLGIGYGLGFHVACHPNAATKIHGAPIPTTISRLQEGQWTPSPLPSLLRELAITVNVLSGVALALLPLGIASVCIELRDDIRARREESSQE